MEAIDDIDIWEWRPDGVCTPGERHPWVIYHTWNIRECACCGVREDLYADFGIVKHTPLD